jgi:sugar phosphate isomerase/epimerase
LDVEETLMLSTRTGTFPIGFRRGGSAWQKDLGPLIGWARDNQLQVIDLAGAPGPEWKAISEAGLRIGTADTVDWKSLLSADTNKRNEAVRANVQHARASSEAGVKLLFFVALPEKPELPRKENFGYLVDSLSALAPELETLGTTLAIEGWPGPGVLCCTPEAYRALFKAVPSPAIGINYDPSHLIRMGIDPIRFLEEFVDRVVHVHGKDTELLTENLYEFGHEQPATFAPAIVYGGWSWRYTIPGHGQMRWSRAFETLKKTGYRGAVCIELEDAHFNGTEDGEKAGLIAAARFLAGC